MIRLTPNFTREELTHSETAVRLGIDNEPSDSVKGNLVLLAQGLERVRKALGDVPIYVSSGFRSPELNKRIGGSLRSQHLLCLAADFSAPAFGTPYDICVRVAKYAPDIRFDQLIHEGRWVHIGFPAIGTKPRTEILTAHFKNGGVSYSKGLTANV